jgi:hypothetical protein
MQIEKPCWLHIADNLSIWKHRLLSSGLTLFTKPIASSDSCKFWLNLLEPPRSRCLFFLDKSFQMDLQMLYIHYWILCTCTIGAPRDKVANPSRHTKRLLTPLSPHLLRQGCRTGVVVKAGYSMRTKDWQLEVATDPVPNFLLEDGNWEGRETALVVFCCPTRRSTYGRLFSI